MMEGESHSSIIPFKFEVKVEIKPYDGKMDLAKLNNWIRKLEVYFIYNDFFYKDKISFS